MHTSVHEPQNHAPGQILVHTSLYDYIICSKKACILGCMVLKIHAPGGQIIAPLISDTVYNDWFSDYK